MIFMLKQVRLGQEGRHTPAILCKMSLPLFRHFHFRSRSFSSRKTIFTLPHKQSSKSVVEPPEKEDANGVGCEVDQLQGWTGGAASVLCPRPSPSPSE